MIAAGELAPLFTATAVYFERPFSLQAWRGQPVLLLFVDYQTARQTEEVARALRRVYPSYTELLLPIIVNLQAVPKPMQGFARTVMESTLRATLKQIPDGVDPANHLLILPDWRNEIGRAYGVSGAGQQMALVLVDENGRVRNTYQGPQPTQNALTLISSLR